MASYITDMSKPLGTVAPSYEGTPTTPTNPTLIPTSELLQPHIVHTFLIRHPRRAVPSYARLCYPGAKTGFDYFDPSEMGYAESRRLFDFIREATGQTPHIVEAETLLQEPKKVVSEYCEAVGVDFNEDMLEWNSATRDHLCVRSSLPSLPPRERRSPSSHTLQADSFSLPAAPSGRAGTRTPRRARASAVARRRSTATRTSPRRRRTSPRRTSRCPTSSSRRSRPTSRTTSTCARSRARSEAFVVVVGELSRAGCRGGRQLFKREGGKDAAQCCTLVHAHHCYTFFQSLTAREREPAEKEGELRLGRPARTPLSNALSSPDTGDEVQQHAAIQYSIYAHFHPRPITAKTSAAAMPPNQLGTAGTTQVLHAMRQNPHSS